LFTLLLLDSFVQMKYFVNSTLQKVNFPCDWQNSSDLYQTSLMLCSLLMHFFSPNMCVCVPITGLDLLIVCECPSDLSQHL